jgi:hypothetical protein
MAVSFRVSTDHAALGRKLEQSVKRFPRAAAAGINRAAHGAFTFSVREIQRNVGTSSQKAIRRNLVLKRATAEKPAAELVAFSAKKDRIPIYEMKPQPRTVTRRRPPGGVRYGRGRLIPGSFIARLGSGHIGVFKRIGAARLPIAELFGPSVALVFSRRKLQERLGAFLREKVPQEIARAFRFVTG